MGSVRVRSDFLMYLNNRDMQAHDDQIVSWNLTSASYNNKQLSLQFVSDFFY
jgi:hypothetical protein